MYLAYGLLQPTSDFALAEAQNRLAAMFPQYSVATNGNQITVSHHKWEIELALLDGPQIAADSQHLAEKLVGIDVPTIAGCNRRVEVWSNTPDQHLEHFGDYQTVIEVVKSFSGVIAVDPKEPGLL